MAKTYNVGRLSIEMVADTVEYVQKVKAAQAASDAADKLYRASLRKTKKDQDSLGTSTQRTTKMMQGLGQAASLVSGPMGGIASRIGSANALMTTMGVAGGAAGMGVAAVGIAVGTAIIATTKFGINLHESQKRLNAYAEVAGTTAWTLEKIAGATSTVGVSQEKYGDIVKDVQDKLGDFVKMGSGPFADVFAILGDNIGYTAQELQTLSGPQILQAVADSMDKMNIPLQQQVFLLESLGNDASLLLPLLKDQGVEMNRLAKEYGETNVKVGDLSTAYGTLSKQVVTFGSNLGRIIAGSGPMQSFITKIGEMTKGANEFMAGTFGDEAQIAEYDAKMLAQQIERVKQSMESLDKTDKSGGMYSGHTQYLMRAASLERLEAEYKVLTAEVTKHAEAQVAADKKIADEKAKTARTQSPTYQDIFAGLQLEDDAAKESLRIQEKRNKAAKKAKDEALRDQKAAAKKAEKARKEELDRMKQLDADEIRVKKETADAIKDQKDDMRELASIGADTGTGLYVDGGINGMGAEASANAAIAMLEMEHQNKMEALKEQYGEQYALTEEYKKAENAMIMKYANERAAMEKQRVMAEHQLTGSIISGIGDQIGALVGATDEEKRALTAQFVMRQGLAAANASIDFFSAKMGIEAAAASMGVAGSAYKATALTALAASYGTTMMGIGAVTLGGVVAGQFHSGSDYVPSEGSYLIQEGERVIQPKANKDLTSFLNDKGGNSSPASSVTQQVSFGGVYDRKTMQSMLMREAQTIAALVLREEKKRGRKR